MEKLTVVCPDHGEFLISPNNHYKGKGCPRCKFRFRNGPEFIEYASALWGNKYDYSQASYSKQSVPVTVVCPEHGTFTVSPGNHTRKSQPCGCPKCGAIKAIESVPRAVAGSVKRIAEKAREGFIPKSQAVHGDKYDYSLVQYEHRNKEVKIVCPTHGVFLQRPAYHIRGFGCRLCQESRGELEIVTLFRSRGVHYEREVVIGEFNPRKSFDFYVPSENLYIEYDGELHFRPFSDSPYSLRKYEQQMQRDKIRNDWCRDHGVKLLIITYKDNVKEVLCRELKI